MKKILFTSLFILLTAISLNVCAENSQQPRQMSFTEGLRFCEGTAAYRNMMLVSNFGTDKLDSKNNEGKGYIASIEENTVKTFIPADGALSAPKGMAVHENYLFIADVNRVVVYNLRDLDQRAVTIYFPEGDDFVNDIVAVGNILLVSVTNTGRIYGLDVSDLNNLRECTPRLMGNVPGANGMTVNGNMLYVASYNTSGTPTGDNVIYSYDLSSPSAVIGKLSDLIPPGQYDGIAVSEDRQYLYFTTWAFGDTPSGIYVYDLAKNGPVQPVNLDMLFEGPADITIKSGYLWIPDLPRSTVFRIPL